MSWRIVWGGQGHCLDEKSKRLAHEEYSLYSCRILGWQFNLIIVNPLIWGKKRVVDALYNNFLKRPFFVVVNLKFSGCQRNCFSNFFEFIISKSFFIENGVQRNRRNTHSQTFYRPLQWLRPANAATTFLLLYFVFF